MSGGSNGKVSSHKPSQLARPGSAALEQLASSNTPLTGSVRLAMAATLLASSMVALCPQRQRSTLGAQTLQMGQGRRAGRLRRRRAGGGAGGGGGALAGAPVAAADCAGATIPCDSGAPGGLLAVNRDTPSPSALHTWRTGLALSPIAPC